MYLDSWHSLLDCSRGSADRKRMDYLVGNANERLRLNFIHLRRGMYHSLTGRWSWTWLARVLFTRNVLEKGRRGVRRSNRYQLDGRAKVRPGRWTFSRPQLTCRIIWPMADGRWPMVDGRWSMVDGRVSIHVGLLVCSVTIPFFLSFVIFCQTSIK